MGRNVTQKLIASHLVAGEMIYGQEVEDDYELIEKNDTIIIDNVRDQLKSGIEIEAWVASRKKQVTLYHVLSARQLKVLLAGGLINDLRTRDAAATALWTTS